MVETKMTPSEAGKLGAAASKDAIALAKQARVEAYRLDPKRCKFCETELNYVKRHNDYCNQSCSAKLLNSNRGFVLSENKVFICLFCSAEFKAAGTEEHKYCSRKCMSAFWWQEAKNKIVAEGRDTSWSHRVAKRYLIEIHEGKCQSCNLSEWLSKPMPLVLDHINGNSEDGSLSNLRVICNNCDALSDTYKSKNKGNGRAQRRERYRAGKSY